MFLQFRLVYLMCMFIIELLLLSVEDAFINHMLNVLWLFNGCHSCGSCLSFSLEALLLSLCFQLGLMCNALFLGLLMLMPFSLCCELSLLSGILLLFDTLFFSKCKLLLMMLLSYECFLLVSQSFSLGMCFSFYTQTLSFSMLGFDTQSLSLSMSLSLDGGVGGVVY